MAADIILILVIVAGAVVPGHFFSTEGFDTDNYFDHIIDLGIERLQLIKERFYLDATFNEPEPYLFGRPVGGTILLDGIRSFSRSKDRSGDVSHTRSKRLENGDIELLSTFRFGNINGSGNFSGVDKHGERKNFHFQFDMTPAEVEVIFLMTKNPAHKRLVFKFAKPNFYSNISSYYLLNVSLLVDHQSQIAFRRLFQDLYSIIYERLVQTEHKHHVYFDNILDKIFKRENEDKDPSQSEYFTRNAVNNIETIAAELNLTFYGLKSMERLAQVHYIHGIDGDIDIRAKIKFGNATGTASVYGKVPGRTFSDRFNFTATPAVVEALFYLPRNKSYQEATFQFINKPCYTIKNARDDLRSLIGKVIEHHANLMYRNALFYILNETQNEVFPDSRKLLEMPVNK